MRCDHQPSRAERGEPPPTRLCRGGCAVEIDEGGPPEQLQRIGQEVRESFGRNKRVMAFGEYYALFQSRPAQFARSASQYLKDVFDHFGTAQVETARGPLTRYKLFDC